jgi:hypothetical protein
MIKIVRYTPDWKSKWDQFIANSKNGTFLFYRDYMEYHSDRFTDISLLVLDADNEILSVLPATLHGDEVRSHGGLTYGGFVMTNRTSAAGENSPLTWLPEICEYLRTQFGIKRLIYKPVPHIYHRQPAEEDLYALFRMNAQINVRNLASAINLRSRIESSRLGKRAVKRQRLNGLKVRPTDNVSEFWDIIMEDRRVRHNTKPVHTGDELQLLRDRFPDNILLYVAETECGEVQAGAVIYRINGVLHLQYAAASEVGKQNYAVDVIYHELLFNLLTGYEYFDFGSSNEDAGRYLNAGMIAHKEEFGARSVVYDSYEIKLD